jgi:predicted small metal-binding protein
MALEFRCSEAGAACGWHARAGTEQELVAKVADHVKSKHKVKTVTQTIANYAASVAREKR